MVWRYGHDLRYSQLILVFVIIYVGYRYGGQIKCFDTICYCLRAGVIDPWVILNTMSTHSHHE